MGLETVADYHFQSTPDGRPNILVEGTDKSDEIRDREEFLDYLAEQHDLERQDQIRRENTFPNRKRIADPTHYRRFLKQAADLGLIGTQFEQATEAKRALYKKLFPRSYEVRKMQDFNPLRMGEAFSIMVNQSQSYIKR